MKRKEPLLKAFLKWWVLAFVLLASILTVNLIAGKFQHADYGRAVSIIAIGATILALFFLFVERVLVPWRKRFISKKVMRIFNAKPVDETRFVYEIGGLQFFISIHIHLTMSLYSSGIERILFHLPKDHYDRLPVKPKGNVTHDHFENIPTRVVHASAPGGLAKAKKRIDRMAVVGESI